jgi:hypothetical protein
LTYLLGKFFFFIFFKDAILPIKFFLLIQYMTSKYSSELEIESGLRYQLWNKNVIFDDLSQFSSQESPNRRNVSVAVIAKSSSQIRFSINNFFKFRSKLTFKSFK